MPGSRELEGSARRQLKRFRQGSALAVAITGFVLLLWGEPANGTAQEQAPDSALVDTSASVLPAADTGSNSNPGRSVEEATWTVRQFANEFAAILPKIFIALALLAAAAIVVRLIRAVLRRLLRGWERADAFTALAGILIWLIAVGAALSIIAGDVRALVGSVGLLGLALSWALQTPIESFAGWLLNSFKGYYRVGDRIAVGDVFGDVYRIDYLNTTVWEAGGPDKAVQAAQPTGALITFPNSEVLRSNVVNHTRGFAYVWDEVHIGVTNESDIRHAMDVIAGAARDTVGPVMRGPVAAYRAMLEKEGLAYDVADEPQVYVALTDSWTDITVRYLVAARERRKWSSALILGINEALAAPGTRERVRGAYPVQRLALQREDPFIEEAT